MTTDGADEVVEVPVDDDIEEDPVPVAVVESEAALLTSFLVPLR